MSSVSSSVVQLQLFSQKFVLLLSAEVPATCHQLVMEHVTHRDFQDGLLLLFIKGQCGPPAPCGGRRRQVAAGARRSHSCCQVPAPGAWGRGRGVAGSCDGSGFSSVLEGRLGRTDSSSMFVSEFECFSRSPDTISLEMDLE